MRKPALLLTLFLAAASLLLASSAGAKTVEFHSLTTSFNGSDANGAPAFESGTLDKVGVDNSSGDVIVATNEDIYKFDSGGASQPFSALSPATVIAGGIGSANAGGLAIDNSGGSTQGRIYAFPEASNMNAYEPSGTQVGEEFPVESNGDTCGVAVDADGNIWRQPYGSPLTEYAPDGSPTGVEVSIEGSREFCAFAIDSQGNFYAPSFYVGGPVSEFAPDGTFLRLISAASAIDVAVDRSTGDIYIDTGSTIDHYNAAGEFVESFGNLTGSNGVAVDAATHAVYALDNGPSASVQKFVSSGSVTVADATTEAATEPERDGATVHGTLNPEGVDTTECRFEYGTVLSGTFSESVGCAEGEAFSGGSDAAVSAVIEGAEAETEYQYRLRVANASGSSYGTVRTFTTFGAVKATETGEANEIDPSHATLHGSFNPDGIDTHYYFEWGTNTSYGNTAPLPPPGEEGGGGTGVKAVSARLSGLIAGTTYHYRLAADNIFGTSYGADMTVVPGAAPSVTGDRATQINTDTAVLEAVVNPNGKATTYHWEYGTEDCSETTCEMTAETSVGAGPNGVPVHLTLESLTPGTTYHFRLVATNSTAPTEGEDHTFITYTPESGIDTCPNVLERKQTGAGATAHCRAYELVSAAKTGGYDVESNLIAGLNPLPGFPNAEGKVLYTMRFGSIPGSGNPPNRGGDPYVATRGANGWTTEYVGLQANGTVSTVPFASTVLEADQRLDSFAFGGPEICDPCFSDGTKNIPLRLPDGSLVKGMAGSESPAAEPAGKIDQSFSADGSSFVFGSTSRFEPAGNEGALTIYERDLGANTTRVVSTNPDGTTMSGSGIAEMGVSADGSRVLIGHETGTDAAGNPVYDLYMHIGDDPHSVPIAAPAGDLLFAGMTADGSKVFFTTPDAIGGDTDSSADLFRADVTPMGATVTQVSTGSGGSGDSDGCNPVSNSDGNHWNEPGPSSSATCGVVAIGGGGGVASESGAVYFLSPENLEPGSDAVDNQPNLYAAEVGSAPEFVATLDPDNPAVRDAVAEAGRRETADFQVTPDGRFAVFGNGSALTENNTAGYVQIYRGEIGGGLNCVSCLPSNSAPAADTFLTKNGLNLVEDGRVFFTTPEQMVLRDTNQLKDVYEWDEGHISLISTGLDSNDSGLLTASADGVDAFFFTRQTLAPQDQNGGAMKIYDAREDGGFLYNPPPRPCVASDECHGPGTQQAPPPAINTIEGTGEPQPPIAQPEKPTKCRKGQVERHGRCVKKKHKKSKAKAGRHGHRKERHHG